MTKAAVQALQKELEQAKHDRDAVFEETDKAVAAGHAAEALRSEAETRVAELSLAIQVLDPQQEWSEQHGWSE